MDTTPRKYSIKFDVQAGDLEKWHKYGWVVEYYQFDSGKLNAIAYKDEIPVPAAPAPAAVKKITTGEMPIVTITPRSVPMTFNRDVQPRRRADVQARREQDNAEILGIMQSYVKTRDEIDRDFKPFTLGVQQ